VSSIFLLKRTLYKSKLFLTCLSSYVKLVEIIFWNEANGYKAVLMDETMILLGFFKRILGRSYALGRIKSLENNEK